jgi:hypothetical protein
MLVNHAWRWKGRWYNADPARPIRFRLSTLRRLYYQWVKGGRVPEALALRYWRGNRKVSMGQVTQLATLCLAPGTMSFSAAFRKLGTSAATESAYRYATPARLRAALAKLLAHRRRHRALERAARQLLKGVAE